MKPHETPEAQFTDNELREPRPTGGSFKLPCGVLDNSGVLHREVVVREITGEEEDMLAARGMSGAKKITALLAKCVQSVGSLNTNIASVVRNMTIGDRVYLMFAIRRVSLGDLYPFRVACPHCQFEDVYMVNLADPDLIREMPEPEKRLYDIELPSGKKARFKVMTGVDEERLGQVNSDRDEMSLSIQVRLEQLDGKPVTIRDVKQLGIRDRNALREGFEEVEGGVETTIEISCNGCSAVFDKNLDIGQDGFFFPSAVLKRLKKRSGI